jgi:xylan 1,4-beta-xylosidase
MRERGFFEEAMKKLAPLSPEFVRIDHLYDYYDVYQLNHVGEPTYKWDELDRVVDAVVAAGAEPLLCLSYLPPELARESVYGPPTDYAAWEELVYQTVRHFNVERGLGIRYWEIWNEPNLPSFWDGSLDDYLLLYQASVKGALRADSSIKLGGPATASLPLYLQVGVPLFERNWVGALVGYVQEHHLPLDFLSWHYYDSRAENYSASVTKHQRWTADVQPPPVLLLTEWNWSGLPAPELDTEVAAAHAAAVLTVLADTPLEQAFFFEPIDSSVQPEGRWGMMHKDGTVKPVYNTFGLAGKLVGERVAVQSNHSRVGALAAKDNDNVTLLVWRKGGREDSLPVIVAVNSLPAGSQMAATVYGLDAENDTLHYGGESLLIGKEISWVSEAGRWETTITLMPNSVQLIQFSLAGD